MISPPETIVPRETGHSTLIAISAVKNIYLGYDEAVFA
jgi:hypothetical protein